MKSKKEIEKLYQELRYKNFEIGSKEEIEITAKYELLKWILDKEEK